MMAATGSLWRNVLLLVVVVRAEEEPFMGQRPVTFDLLELEEDLQKPVPFSLHDFPELVLDVAEKQDVVPDIPDVRRPYPAGSPMFGPRSRKLKEIPFPLARPNINNIQAICNYSNQRPRYPKKTLPRSGFGYLSRQANSINQLESWFSVCCSSGNEDQGMLLCCAEQAWKKSLSAFCDEEFSVKTSHYHCCMQSGSKRRSCFEKASPSNLQSYVPSDHERGSRTDVPSMTKGFNFNPNTCHKQRSLIAPRATRGKIPNVIFPPARPNSDNIESICANHKQRWWYVSRCVREASGGMEHLPEAINALERGFGQCCKKRKERESCAEMKWKTMVDDFCKDGMKAEMKHFDCCEKEKGEEQYTCFSAAATNPGYTPDSDVASLYQTRPSLDTFCDVYRPLYLWQRDTSSWHTVADEMFSHCCSSVFEEKKSECLPSQMESFPSKQCDRPFLTNGSCCNQRGKSRSKCFAKYVLQKLTEETGVEKSLRRKCRTLL